MNPLPGGNVRQIYMDGVKDQTLPFSFQFKSKQPQLITNLLWQLSIYVDKLKQLPSQDGSYEFQSIDVANQPFMSNKDESGYYYAHLDINANLTTYEEKETD